MVAGEDWQALVPAPVAGYIERIDGVGRVRAVASAEGQEEKE